MSQPIVANNRPVKVTLEEGKKYLFCACGRSENQPFCDGSHTGTGLTPKAFVAEKTGASFLCACKQSKNQPFCDGSHNRVTEDMIGKSVSPSSQKSAASLGSKEEPHVALIHEMARHGLEQLGHHGPMTAMGVPRYQLPEWDDIQIMTAQLSTRPLPESTEVDTRLVIGPEAKKPLELNIPLFVSDMSFGALSEEAKTALARGAEMAGTGICSGEGGMLPEEQRENRRYFYELASAMFGYQESLLENVQAFHFKCGQGAKTGTGGHLPGEKNQGKVAAVRGIPAGQDAISPPTFETLRTVADFKRFADRVRVVSGGIPIGFKLSANHIEKDVDFALEAGADYLILDGRGGGTGAAPALFRDHISVPTIPALARARRHLDMRKASGRVTLIITGGLRVPSDFVKALALGADGIALSNSAMQAIGCVGARICNSNMCPAGIATQDPELRKKLNVEDAAQRLNRFFRSSTDLMSIMARACGHDRLSAFSRHDLSTWKKAMSELSGVTFSGYESE